MFLPGESQGWGSLVGCRLWGRIESDMTEAMQQQQQHDPVILLLGIYAEKTIIQKDTCTPMFIAELFAIVRIWNQPK